MVHQNLLQSGKLQGKKSILRRLVIFTFFLSLTGISFSQVAGDYRSTATGNWTDAATWETYDGLAWVPATTPPDGASGTITIQSGTTVTVDVTQTIAEGALLVNSGDLAPAASGYIYLYVNGTYEHAQNGGTLALPGPSGFTFTQWGSNSICLITGLIDTEYDPSTAVNMNGTMIWDCPNQSIDLSAKINSGTYVGYYIRKYFNSINNFKVLNSNGHMVHFSYLLQAISFTIGGDVTVDGANSKLSLSYQPYQYGNGSMTLNNLVVDNGAQCFLNSFVATQTISININIKQNLTVLNNSALGNYYTGSGVGYHRITFGFVPSVIDLSGLVSTGLTADQDQIDYIFGTGGVTLNSPVTAKSLTVSGMVYSNANLITILPGGTISGGGTSAFIDGPVAYDVESTGPLTLNYPVGKGTDYRPVQLDITQDATTTTTYTAEMFNSAPPVNTIPASLASVSNIRYYSISKSAGANATAAALTLNYGVNDNVTVNAALRIAKNDGTGNWVDLGGSGSAPVTGTITSTNNFTDFSGSDFVLASGPTATITGNVVVEGVTLSWTDGIPMTTTSDINGDYSITVSDNWSGTVTPTFTGYTFTPASRSYSNLTSDISNEDYTANPILFSISGNVGVGGALLSWDDNGPQTTTADGSGNYSFTVSYSWTGTVTPSLSGWAFIPEFKSYTNVLADQLNQDYFAGAGPVAMHGVYTIGQSDDDFTTLTAATFAMEYNDIDGPVTLELQADYDGSLESFPITFSNVITTTASNTITVIPAADATGLSINSTGGDITFLLAGASYVTIDGRPGGIGTSKELSISNTSTETVVLQEQSNHNNLQYLNIQGQSTTYGVIYFRGISVTGNNTYNTIDHCDIASTGSGTPASGIYSYSNVGGYNTNNTISNCNIQDFGTYGISLSTGNADWNIDGNSFFQTAVSTPSSTVYVIYIYSALTGSTHTISNNFIGGSMPNAGGAPWTKSHSNFYGMYFLNNSSAYNYDVNVLNNTITNLHLTLSSNFKGIYISNSGYGPFNITGNTIGSSTNTDAIVREGGTGVIYGIHKIGNYCPLNATNNTIGGITTTGGLYGIYATASTATSVIEGNTIGSTTVANSITNTSSATAAYLIGIYGTSNASGSISNNTVANLTNTYNGTSTTGYVRGIYTYGSGVFNVNQNTIFNLKNASAQIGTRSSASINGIVFSVTGNNSTCKQNKIYGLENTSTTGVVNVNGVMVDSRSGTIEVSGNSIAGLNMASSDITAQMNGIHIYGYYSSWNGTTYVDASVQNNEIHLGADASGSGINTGYIINGIFEEQGADDFYFNSILISGAAVSGTTSNTNAFLSNVINNARVFENNVFSNVRSGGTTGKHYALTIAGTAVNPAGLTIDYNDYFVSGTNGILGYFNGVDVTTLAAWQTAVGQDVNSLNDDPLFTSATDFYPQATSTMINAGTPIAGITSDINGIVRDPVTPTIGAYEFVPCISNPTDGGTIAGAQADCAAFDPDPITSTAPATGQQGILEYKWQQSTTSSTTGFVDIPNSNSLTYDPGVVTQTTWFRRLAQVTCFDWTTPAPAESNVLAMTVTAIPAQPVSGGDITECSQSPIQTLTATAYSEPETTVVWFTSETGDVITTDPTLSSVGTVTYWAAAQNTTSLCYSTTRIPVTLTINQSYVTNTNTGTMYCTLQDAIDNASSGDVLDADAHTFFENIVISVPNLTLQTSASAVIDGGTTGVVVAIVVPGVTLDGFTIQNGGQTDPNTEGGVAIYNPGMSLSGVTVKNCTVQYCAVGIAGVNSTGNTIQDNIAHDNGYGIAVGEVSMPSTFYTISGNEVYNNQVGIYIDKYCSDNTISTNTIYNNALEGIYLYATQNCEVTGNILTNTGAAGTIGIEFSYSSGNTVTGNTVTGHERGFWIRKDTYSGNTIQQNIIAGNTVGMELTEVPATDHVTALNNWWGDASGPYHATYNTCGSGNPVLGDVDFDPWLDDVPGTGSPVSNPVVNTTQDRSYCIITDAVTDAVANDVIDVAAGTYSEHIVIDVPGLTLQTSAGAIIDGGTTGIVVTIVENNVTVDGFTVQNGGQTNPNGEGGIFAYNPLVVLTGITIQNCTVQYCAVGIAGVNSTGNTIQDNIAHDNGYGIAVGEVSVPSTFYTISGNEVYNNQVGIYIDKYCANNTISTNIIYNNALEGIYLYATQNCVVTDNTLTNTGAAGTIGIEFSYSSGNTVTGNTVSGHERGFWIRKNTYTGNTIQQNTITGNTVGMELTEVPATDNVTALNNWWGDASGPYHAVYNSCGLGDPIVGKVDFDPWLDDVPATGSPVSNPVVNVTQGTSYCTIQDAIDDAGIDETIELASGTYNEDLIIPAGKTNLEITAATGATVVLKGVANLPVASWPQAAPNIEILADGANIHGLTIQSPAYAAGYYSSGIVIGAPNVAIYDNDFFVGAGDDANGDEVSQAIQTYNNGEMTGVDISGLNIYNNTFVDQNPGQWGYEGIYVNPDDGTGTINISGNQFTGDLIRAISVLRSGATIDGNTIITDLVPYAGPGALDGISIHNSVAQNNIAITNNTVGGSALYKGFNRGIRVGLSGEVLTGFVISGNTVTINATGVAVRSSADGVLVNSNLIYDNTTGLNNESAPLLNAEGNWWGSITGPTATTNPCGTGDIVLGNVDFDPWKDDALLSNDVYLLLAQTVTGDAAICPDGNTDVTLGGSQPGANYEYDLYRNGVLVPASTLAGTGSALVWNVTEAGPDPVVYTVKATNTTTGCTLDMTGSATITINPLPAANAGTDQTTCSGVGVQIGAAAVAGSTYDWTSDPAGYTSIEANPTVAPTVTTTYTLVETSATGCVNSNSVIITVNPLPVANDIVGNEFVCTGSTLEAYGVTTDNSLTASYLWAFDGTGATLSSTSGASITIDFATDATNGTLSVVETDNTTGCSTTNTLAITINPLPAAVAGTAQTICENESVQIGATAVAGSTYEWISDPAGFTSTVADPTVAPVVTTIYTVTETVTATGCTNSNSVTITVDPAPVPVISGNVNPAGGSTVVYSTPDVEGHTYVWNVTGDFSSVIPSGNLCEVTWLSTGTSGTVEVTETITATGCFATASVNITLNPIDLQGTVTYHNLSNTPMANLTVTLTDLDGVYPDQVTTTDVTGHYSFDGLLGSNYRLILETAKAWGGGNSTDALAIQRTSVFYTFPWWKPADFVDNTADVNESGSILSSDALLVKKRTVYLINSFPAGDWAFWHIIDPDFSNNVGENFVNTADNIAYLDFAVGGTTTIDVKAMCYGDVNGSYLPPSTKSTSMVAVKNEGKIEVKENKPFELPVQLLADKAIGAMTIHLNYPTELLSITDLKSEIPGLVYTLGDGWINVAWSDLDPITIASGGVLFTMQCEAKAEINDYNEIFMQSDETQFADPYCNVLNDVFLNINKIDVLYKDGGLDPVADYAVSCYPNPVKEATTIAYSLPENGDVLISITNAMGHHVTDLVKQHQESGNYNLAFDPSKYNLESGVYFCRIVVEGESRDFTEIVRIVYMR